VVRISISIEDGDSSIKDDYNKLIELIKQNEIISVNRMFHQKYSDNWYISSFYSKRVLSAIIHLVK
jgi:hypothetical protein